MWSQLLARSNSQILLYEGENDTNVVGTFMNIIYRKLQYNSALGLNIMLCVPHSIFNKIIMYLINIRINVLMLRCLPNFI